jgi:hypothetical protein
MASSISSSTTATPPPTAGGGAQAAAASPNNPTNDPGETRDTVSSSQTASQLSPPSNSGRGQNVDISV